MVARTAEDFEAFSADFAEEERVREELAAEEAAAPSCPDLIAFAAECAVLIERHDRLMAKIDAIDREIENRRLARESEDSYGDYLAARAAELAADLPEGEGDYDPSDAEILRSR